MILVGIDDTDILDARGTNKLARALAERVAPRWRCDFILRHQLLVDPRIPYTSHNGSASLHLRPLGGAGAAELAEELRAGMLADFVEGSDPGLCVAEGVPEAVVAFGQRCRREVVDADEARALAAAHGLRLEGLGGTEGGVIGALAAVGLGACGDYGRVVVNGAHPDDLSGEQTVAAVRARGVEAILPVEGGPPVEGGLVDVGKHLRPNRRGGRTVLFVEPSGAEGWRVVRRD